MEIAIDPIYIFLSIVLIFIGMFLCYRISRTFRLRSLSKLGFKVTSKVDNRLRKKLKRIAPYDMQPPQFSIGMKSIGNPILIWWYAELLSNSKEIYIWCYRKAESYRTENVENWWQSILVIGFGHDERIEIIRKIRLSMHTDVEIIEENDTLLVLYKRPLFFSKTIAIIKYVVRYA